VLTGKTGYTDLALYCLAIAVRMTSQQSHDVAMVFLGAVGKMTRFADFQRTAQWLTERKWKAAPATAEASKAM
jgi:D-alanyl-D-alanine carboxypeptidase